MANWTMTVNGNEYRSAELSVGLWSSVAQLLGARATDFDMLQPYVGPDQMAAWWAVLMAHSSDIKDVQTHLLNAYSMPLAQLVQTINVE